MRRPKARGITAGFLNSAGWLGGGGRAISPVGFAKHASERAAALVHQEFKTGVNSLATISLIAPLLGMFGTLVGIRPLMVFASSVTTPVSLAVSGFSMMTLDMVSGSFTHRRFILHGMLRQRLAGLSAPPPNSKGNLCT